MQSGKEEGDRQNPLLKTTLNNGSKKVHTYPRLAETKQNQLVLVDINTQQLRKAPEDGGVCSQARKKKTGRESEAVVASSHYRLLLVLERQSLPGLN